MRMNQRKYHFGTTNTRREFNKKFFRTVVSRKIAFFLFVLSVALLAICVWKEGDQLWSYFIQESTLMPPVLVVSSDDWGGDNPPETVEDLNKLQETLISVTDAEGQPLVLTAYLNPAEPNFEEIAKGQYTSYSYCYCYRNKPEVALRLRELHKTGLVDIEFHGREHYNIPLWMSLLKEDRPGFREACRTGRVPWREGPGWDIEADPRLSHLRESFLDASSYPLKALSIEEQREMITSGLAMMEENLGIRSVVFTPSGYAYDTNTLQAMGLAGIWYLDSKKRCIPTVSNGLDLIKSRQFWDYPSEITGIKGIVRNMSFEPYRKRPFTDTVIRARRAILSGRPIVISSHRWNYVNAVNPNRDRDLLLLQKLVKRIKSEAPDLVFLGASDLVRHLYEGGAQSRRHVELKTKKLMGMDRVMHGLRCTLIGHGRILAAFCIVGLSLLWLCMTKLLRRSFQAA